MRNYIFGNLPPSFFDLWQTNRERNALRELRNADDLYIPPHRTDKRMPLVSFPSAWNTIDNRKFNPRQSVFLKELKAELLAGLES